MEVSQFYNKNQFIITSDRKTVFQSYNSTIAVIDEKGLTLGRNWDYSKTTMKHLYLFLEEKCYLEVWRNIQDKSNKRAAIQKMIDDGLIVYDESLI